jgi:hypothetical protein
MSDAKEHVKDVLDQISTDPKVLKAARKRRNVVKSAALKFDGMRRAYDSGSIAMGVANDPVLDADGGVVIDRRVHPELGPDGAGGLPTEIVEDLHEFIGPEVRKTYPDATVHDMKRGLTVCVHDPVIGDQDPFVDLVVAMERKDKPGLWIPNLDADRWDASHPEKHVELMVAGPSDVRRVRGQVTRLGKAWNKQYSSPALSSFNIAAIARECIDEAEELDDALYRFFDYAVASLRQRRTPDPAGVSEPIKLPLGKDTAIDRLGKARDNMKIAVESDDADERLQAMHDVFWDYLPQPTTTASRRSIAHALRTGAPRVSTAGAVVRAMKPARSYGGTDVRL